MAPPGPKNCYVAQCEFVTSNGLPNYEMVMRDLELHVRCAHPELAHTVTVDQPKNAAISKPDRLPRPTLTEGITEADWLHFCDKWARYKRSTLVGADKQLISDQLWACCDPELEVSVYNSGIKNDTNEQELLEAMKKLSVRSQNTLVNVVRFLEMGQDQDESAGAYVARLKGQANVCDFAIKCTAAGCIQNVSYMDQMVTHQLIRGLSDHTI